MLSRIRIKEWLCIKLLQFAIFIADKDTLFGLALRMSVTEFINYLKSDRYKEQMKEYLKYNTAIERK